MKALLLLLSITISAIAGAGTMAYGTYRETPSAEASFIMFVIFMGFVVYKYLASKRKPTMPTRTTTSTEPTDELPGEFKGMTYDQVVAEIDRQIAVKEAKN